MYICIIYGEFITLWFKPQNMLVSFACNVYAPRAVLKYIVASVKKQWGQKQNTRILVLVKYFLHVLYAPRRNKKKNPEPDIFVVTNCRWYFKCTRVAVLYDRYIAYE